jgi:transposase
MRKGLFWLGDRQWACIKPHLPTNQTGPERDDDRRIISGIVHMLQCGARWRDCPPEYGPYTTIYNRFNRWSKRGHWQAIFKALANGGKDAVTLSIDSTSIKAHRSASGGKGGSMNRRSVVHAVDAHQNPRTERCGLQTLRISSHSRPGRRYRRRAGASGTRAAHGRPHRRQGL